MSRLRGFLVLTCLPLAACGGSLALNMTPRSPAFVDESSVSPRLQADPFQKIMIVPPSGSAGVEFQENLAAVERSFIARGITVISSAITSRVILEDQTRDHQRSESGLQLSEVERALLLAKQSNADAVLQIGTWEWVDSDASAYGWRYFVQDKASKTYVEAGQDEFNEAPVRKLLRRRYGSAVLGFTGRLINVENGEVLASFKIDVPVVNVADPLMVMLDGDGNVQSQSYDWAKDSRRYQAARGRAVGALFDRLASLLSQG